MWNFSNVTSGILYAYGSRRASCETWRTVVELTLISERAWFQEYFKQFAAEKNKMVHRNEGVYFETKMVNMSQLLSNVHWHKPNRRPWIQLYLFFFEVVCHKEDATLVAVKNLGKKLGHQKY